MTQDSNKLHWAVDSLTARNGTVFGFGWIFHEELPIRNIAMRLVAAAEEKQWTLKADHGKMREDVGHTFSAYPTSTHSGFVIVGGCCESDAEISEMALFGQLTDETAFEVEIPLSTLRSLAGTKAGRGLSRPMMAQWMALLRRGLELIRTGRFSVLREKTSRYFRGRPKGKTDSPRVLLRRARRSGASRFSLVVDHDLGGGANQYRDQLVAERVAEGGAVLTLSYHLPSLSYKLAMNGPRLDESYAIPGFDVLINLARDLPVSEIIYNTAVSLARPQDIPPLLVALKEDTGAQLIMMVHDFFMVCPSHFLLNDRGVFCGVPDESVCRECLKRNTYGFTSLFRDRNIVLWRARWSQALACADEIRFFSEGTLSWFRRAYPLQDFTQAKVVPHTIANLRVEKLTPTVTDTLRIGVIGHIGYHKGSRVISALADEIRRRRAPVSITILGTIETHCDPLVVREMGAYNREDLPELIRSCGINVILFPSICWETFSYVVQEAIELNLPVASFDLGAPADRLRRYEKGMILRSQEPGSMLDDLIELHRRIYIEG